MNEEQADKIIALLTDIRHELRDLRAVTVNIPRTYPPEPIMLAEVQKLRAAKEASYEPSKEACEDFLSYMKRRAAGAK